MAGFEGNFPPLRVEKEDWELLKEKKTPYGTPKRNGVRPNSNVMPGGQSGSAFFLARQARDQRGG